MTTVLHYLGNEEVAVPFAHGNSNACSSRSYMRTCPSVLKTIEEECKVTTLIKAYRNAITMVHPVTHLPACETTSQHQTSKEHPLSYFRRFSFIT